MDVGLVEATPSKVRRVSGEAEESPSDQLSAREQRRKTPMRKSIKFEVEKATRNITGDIEIEEAVLQKVFTSSDSFEVARICDSEVAKFFICKVCMKYPREAKVSENCHHIYCRTCIDNFRENINSTKCPPTKIWNHKC